jgi:P-type conjugative transfer protein TrbJ
MKRFQFLSLVLLGLLFTGSKPTHALIVECANCATIQEELISDAKQAQQYATQLNQYQTQLNQYANMVRNTVALPQQIWSNVSSDIYQVRNLANAASVLTGHSGTIMSRLSSAQGYAGQAAAFPANMGNQFTMWQQNLANASNSLGRTLGLQQSQMTNDAALQQRIQAQSASATGQMQAIQAGNELAALTSKQLNEMQTTLTANAQLYATQTLNQADQTAQQNAALMMMTTAPAVATAGYRNY